MRPFDYGLFVAMLFIFFVFLIGISQKTLANNTENDDKFCLAQNIYFESGNQPLAGRVAVAQVTINRVEDKQFPNSICGVVYQAKIGTNWRGELYPIRN